MHLRLLLDIQLVFCEIQIVLGFVWEALKFIHYLQNGFQLTSSVKGTSTLLQPKNLFKVSIIHFTQSLHTRTSNYPRFKQVCYVIFS